MTYKVLGNTNLRISEISFGAAPLGEEYGPADFHESQRSVHYAIEHGINYFDVAPYYGENLAEIQLGKILVGKRSEIILATKVGRYKQEGGEYFDFSPKGIRKSLETSLQNLRTDYLDVYQLHDIEFVAGHVIADEALPTLMQLKKEGKIRFVGITGYPLYLLRDISMRHSIDVILSYSRYNLTDTSLNDVLGDVVSERGIGLINASPLNMGLLTAKGPPAWHPVSEAVIEKVRLVRAYCHANGTTIEKVALQFALKNRLVSSTLIGMSKTVHVDRNLKVIGDPLDAGVLADIMDILAPVKNLFWEEGISENFDPGSVPRKTSVDK